jgi:hypothetical protein
MASRSRVAELQYSQKLGRIELVVPNGTKVAQIAKLKEALFGDVLKGIPRGCTACISGESLLIREQLENVVRVDLDTMKVLGGP